MIGTANRPRSGLAQKRPKMYTIPDAGNVHARFGIISKGARPQWSKQEGARKRDGVRRIPSCIFRKASEHHHHTTHHSTPISTHLHHPLAPHPSLTHPSNQRPPHHRKPPSHASLRHGSPPSHSPSPTHRHPSSPTSPAPRSLITPTTSIPPACAAHLTLATCLPPDPFFTPHPPKAGQLKSRNAF